MSQVPASHPRLRRKITEAILVAVSLICFCNAQTQPKISQQADTATCSNIVVNGGVSTFSCSGLTAEQAKILHDIPALLTKVLRQEKQDSAAILARLNECLEQGAPRSIPEDKRLEIIKWITPAPGLQLGISIFAPNHTAESQQYAEKLRSLFQDAGWVADPVSYTMRMGNGGPDEQGVLIIAHDNQDLAAKAIASAFEVAGVQVDFYFDQRVSPKFVQMIVGQKPSK
jgi:hypothetical protein